MKIKSQKDFWSGIMFLAVGLGFAWGATTYSFGQSARPGPGYFPFGLGILMAVLGVAVLFMSMTIESEGGDPIGAVAWRPLIIIVGSIAMFAWTLPNLGMYIALPLLVMIAALAGDEFHLGEAAFNAAILTGGSWLVFIKGLNLTIPLLPTVFGLGA